jgi:tetratricopeptide (TPR) repeat protein
MSRFYLIGFLLLPFLTFSQAKLKDILTFADQQYQKGDYYYALDYYQQALVLDPENLDLVWKIAETNKAYKDYVQAEKYYASVYSKDEDGERYPDALLNYALMQKQNGKYKEALEHFKTAKKAASEDKTSYRYKKAAQEVESTNWALKQVKIGPDLGIQIDALGENINSYDAEFGHTINNGLLYFSSLKADSVNEEIQEVYSPHYHTALYEVNVAKEKDSAQKLQDLIPNGKSIGNGSFSSDGHFYYSVCSDKDFNYTCAIVFSQKGADGKWRSLDSLNQVVNQAGVNTTMPHFSILNKEPVLFFASNRSGTKGGMDLWYTKLDQNGNPTSVENISSINSLDHDICPWFDTIENRLYFSSSWHQGFGGQDVFFSEFRNGKFGAPINVGLPLNSPAADQYYFQSGDSTFVSSNRLGSLYAKNPTCCSDIYMAEIPRRKPIKVGTQVVASLPYEVVKLPIRLYFENDQPDANTTSNFTNLSYVESYQKYEAQFETYKTKVALQRDSAQARQSALALQSFFEDEVQKGKIDLEKFTNQVWFELQKGNRVQLMVQGFASPLAKTDYNVHLTKRRIQSLKNYFEEVQQGRFGAYMIGENPVLEFIEVPMGEFKANKETSDDYYDQKNSVYSKAASQERRIEIIELRITGQ